MFYDGVLTATYKNIFKFLKVTLCTMPAHRKCLL